MWRQQSWEVEKIFEVTKQIDDQNDKSFWIKVSGMQNCATLMPKDERQLSL